MQPRTYLFGFLPIAFLCVVSCSKGPSTQEDSAGEKNSKQENDLVEMIVDEPVVEALIMVSRTRPGNSNLSADQSYAQEFEIYRSTQVALLKSTFVLKSALSKQEVAGLRTIVERRSQELAWLKERLEVDPVDDSEILRVTLRGIENPNDAVAILDAVIEAYTKEAIYRVVSRNADTIESLNQQLKKLTRELEEKYDQFLSLKEELGEEEPEHSKLELLADEVENLRQVRSKLEIKIREEELQAESESSRIRVLQQATSL